MNTAPASASAPGLLRVLGPWTATAVVIGTVIGSGVFKKPQAVAQQVPEFGPAMLVWVLVGGLAIMGALVIAEVASLYPRAGGNYVFLLEGYGRPFGFLYGWVEFWIVRTSSIAALAAIFADSLCELSVPSDQMVRFWPRQWFTVAVILALAAVNARGVRWGGFLQLAITVVKVGSLVAIALLPFVARSLTEPKAPTPAAAAHDWNLSNFGAALVAVIWAYHGWMNGAMISGEVARPQRNLPIAFLVGVGTVMVLYLGANLAYHTVMTSDEMATLPEGTSVVSEFGRRLLGPWGGAAADAILMISVFGALNGNVLVGPRLLYAMGADRLAPTALGQVSPRYHTPVLAIFVVAGWSALLVLLVGVAKETGVMEQKSSFDVITDFAMFGAVAFETLAVLSIIAFRRKRPDAPRPYRCPGYPVVPVLYALIMAAVLANMFFKQRTEALTGVGFITVGVLVYLAFGRRSRQTGEPGASATGGLFA